MSGRDEGPGTGGKEGDDSLWKPRGLKGKLRGIDHRAIAREDSDEAEAWRAFYSAADYRPHKLLQRNHLLGLGLVVMAVLFMFGYLRWVEDDPKTPFSAPDIDGTLYEYPDCYSLVITEVDHPPSVYVVHWVVEDKDGSVVASGNLGDALGLNLNYTNVRNRSLGLVSMKGPANEAHGVQVTEGAGVIFSKALFDQGTTGIGVGLKHLFTDEWMVYEQLDRARTGTGAIETGSDDIITTLVQADGNLSFATNIPLSHHPVQNQPLWELTLDIVNRGNVSRNVDFTLRTHLANEILMDVKNQYLPANATTTLSFKPERPLTFTQNYADEDSYEVVLNLRFTDSNGDVLLEGRIETEGVYLEATGLFATGFDHTIAMMLLGVLVAVLQRTPSRDI